MSVAGDVASGLVAVYIVDKVTGKRKKVFRKRRSPSKSRKLKAHKRSKR